MSLHYPSSLFALNFFILPVLTKGIEMLPYMGNGRLDLIPRHMDRFAHFLRGACSVNVEGAGKFKFVQVFIDYSKEIYD